MGEYERELIRRATQLCRSAEPHGVPREAQGCKKHVAEARLALAVEDAYGNRKDRLPHGG